MRCYIEKYKNEIFMFLFVFIIYSLLASIFLFNTTIFYETNNTYDVLLDTDTGVIFRLNPFAIGQDNVKHILFSTIVPLFAFPIYILSKLLESKIDLSFTHIYGAGLIFLQIFISSTSITLIYNYLRNTIINNNKVIFLIICIFAFSFPQLFMTLNVERFIYAQLSIIIFIYFVNKLHYKESYWIDIFAIPLFGITLTNIYLYITYSIIKYKMNIKKYIKHLSIFLIASYIVIVSSKASILVFKLFNAVESDTRFNFTGSIIDKLQLIISRLLYPIVYFPGYEIVEYNKNGIDYRMFQTSNINYLYIILLLIVIFICIISFIKNKNNIVVSLSFFVILFNIFLHGVVGYNLVNANIMTIHFSFAIIILLAHYCKDLGGKHLKYMNIFLLIFLITIVLSNIDGFLSILKLGVKILPR